MEQPDKPLPGTRVIDMTEEKGELCARLLGDLGADVIRVEPPGGSDSRRLPPFAPDGATSLSFAYRNGNKRGVTLDVTTVPGRDLLHRLLDGADILVESFPPGHLASLGLDPAYLTGRHSRLIVASITDFGQTGPYRDFAGTNMVGFAMGGMMFRAGDPDRPPLAAPGALAYGSTDITATFAVLTAYYQRWRTGRGQHLDVSVIESVANMSDWSLPSFSVTGAHNPRSGTGPLYPYYRCADGYVRTILLSRRQWQALREWLGDPDVLRDEVWEQPMFRAANRDVLDPLVAELFRDRPKVEVAREGQQRGLPVTPVLTPGEVLRNEHTDARGTFRTLEVLPGLTGIAPAGFFHIDGTRLGPRTPAPAPGEHNAEVYIDELGLPRDQVAALGGGGAVERGRDPAPAIAEGGRAADPVTGPAPNNTGATPPYPFAGVRVLDFGIGGVGVEVGRSFAEYGADVIKVESMAAPDFIRVIGGTMMTPSFASSSRSKRSLGVNLRTEKGRGILHQLIRRSDVIIENSATGAMERIGLGYDAVRGINPRVVMVSSQVAGRTGPWRNWTGYGPSTHPISGLSSLWNYSELTDRPGGSQNIYPDHLVGRLGAMLGVAALIRRERTGAGAHADVAQFEVPIGLLGDLYLQESLMPGSAVAPGNSSGQGAPWGAYPCAGEDTWCVINVRTDEEWRRLRSLIGGPAWARRTEYDSAADRFAHRAALDEELSAWTRPHDAYHLMALLQGRGIPAGVVLSPAEQLADPHLAERGYHRPVDQPPYGRIVLEGPAFRGTGLPGPIIRRAPGLGEHTRAICTELLEMTHAEIDALLAEGVLEQVEEPALSQPQGAARS